MKRLALVISTLVLASGICFAQTSAFTYQGKLASSGAPANGSYQFEFKLFDAAVGGDQVAATQTVIAALQNGAFSTRLDFGATAFATGQDRWLEIALRLNHTGDGYRVLTPRQQINSAPFAVRSLRASSAENADNATNAMSAVSATTAGNVSGVVPIENGGTGSTTGDGSGLKNVPGTLKWTVITGNQQAEPNKAYLVHSPGEIAISLPTTPQIGDVVRVADTGIGGFRITPHSEQSIVITLSTTGLWVPRESNRKWRSVASSADGAKLVAVVDPGQIYTSADSGRTWTPREANRFWKSVASSADGTKLVAVSFAISVDGGEGADQIHTSTDSGVTWTARGPEQFWSSVASSADGTKLVATDGGYFSVGQIYTSTDSGVTWTARGSGQFWSSVASSADGTKLVATVGPAWLGNSISGQIYTSTDSGATWIARDANRSWTSVASSADGTKLVAVVSAGQIYISTDSGSTWTARETNRGWRCVASSSDGTKLVAGVFGGQIYKSTDSGLTWTPHDTNRNWQLVASSADGAKLVAGVFLGQIYFPPQTAASGSVSYLAGAPGSSVELVYMGDGKFFLVTAKGNTELF